MLAPATSFGKNLLPRVAALLDVTQISDITGIDAPTLSCGRSMPATRSPLCNRPIQIKVITVRGTAFDAAPHEGGTAPIEPVDAGAGTDLPSSLARSCRNPNGRNSPVRGSSCRAAAAWDRARISRCWSSWPTSSVPRSAQSRAAVDAGFVPNDYQVGQTGKIVAPELYIAVGISGAIQHLAGMKDSKVIVAINKDDEAPIFQIADYGLVGDLFKPSLSSLNCSRRDGPRHRLFSPGGFLWNAR